MDRLLELYKNGYGYGRLAGIFGLSKSGVAKKIKKAGEHIPNRGCVKPELYCKTCDKRLISDQQSFCSRSCSAKFYNKARNIFRNCAVCDKPHKNNKFCSYECSASTRRLDSEERKKRLRLKTLIAVRRYQARKLNQMPSNADVKKIKEIYANCPVGYEVDHKIPISKGGLHHEDNLQYLLKSENRRKSNKLDYTPLAERVGT